MASTIVAPTYRFINDTSNIAGHASNEYDSTIADKMDHIRDGSELHECIYGEAVPIYDFDDFKYDTQKMQESRMLADYFIAEAAVCKVFPTASLLWTIAAGRKHGKVKKDGKQTPDLWINSFHCVVRRAGKLPHLGCINTSFRVEGMDTAYPTGPGLRKCYRVVWTAKKADPERIKVPFVVADNKFILLTPDQYDNNQLKALTGYGIDGYLASNVQGERLIDVSKQETKREAKKSVYVKKQDCINDLAKDLGESIATAAIATADSEWTIDMPFATAIVDMLAAWRAIKRADWISVIWAIAGTELQYPHLKLLDLAKSFSMRTDADNYDEDGCENEYKRAGPNKNGYMMTLGTLRMWAKQDSPEAYAELCAKYGQMKKTAELKSDDFKYFSDYKQMVCKTVELKTIETWANACIFPVIGKKKVYLLKHKAGDIETASLLNVRYEHVLKGDLQEQTHVKVTCANPDWKEGSKRPQYWESLWTALEWLIERERIKTWNGFDFLPWNKVEPPKTERFNKFLPFEWKSYQPTDEIKFEASHTYEFIREIVCNNDAVDKGLFKAVMQEVASMIQFPGRRAQKFVMLQGKAGSGKSTMLRFLKALLGVYGRILERASDLFTNFNAMLESLIGAFIEEFGEGAELHKHCELAKGFVTSKDITITLKGIDSYQVLNFMRLWFATEHGRSVHAIGGMLRRMFGIEVSDAKAGDKAYFKRINDEIDNPNFLKAAFDYFSEYDLSDYNPVEVFQTEFVRKRAQEDMELPLKHLVYLMTPPEDDSDELKELHISVKDLFDRYHGWAQQEEGAMTKMTKTSYESFMTNFLEVAPTDRVVMPDNRRQRGWKIPRDTIEKLLQKRLKKPGYRLP